MVERRDLFRICRTLPISDTEKNRRPAGGDARTAVRQVLSFIRQVAEPSICGTGPSVRSSRRTPRNHRSHAPRSHGNRGSHHNHRNLGEQHRRAAEVAVSDFLIEEIERGETDVGHFLFAKNEALIGRDL